MNDFLKELKTNPQSEECVLATKGLLVEKYLQFVRIKSPVFFFAVD
ncbi:hypothetical protein [Planomicrobium sp. YIM 101495]|nr:hypothetical protein [Planomicrobium sp. YIM 101495]MTD30569.1 hypothetical protein [Planomicrobium sp. YIM 101495]